jgi:hypothetical protein
MRIQKMLRKALRQKLPALLPSVHQLSNKTALDRYP